MVKKIFRIGRTFVNLPFVTRFDVTPGPDWETDPEDRRPSMFITIVGNGGIRVIERDAVDAGFADMDDLAGKLSDALDALDG